MPKVSDTSSYPALTGSQLANNDRFYVVDAGSPNVGSGIVASELAQAPQFSSRYAPLPTWTSWTPTVTAATGTLTTVANQSGKYMVIGKLAHVQFAFQITDKGTGSGAIKVVLPVAVDSAWQYCGVGTWLESFNGINNGFAYTLTGTDLLLINPTGTSPIDQNNDFFGGMVTYGVA